MKKILFFLIVSFQMIAPSQAQSFEYIYSTPDDEQIFDVVQDSADNYYMVGIRGTFGAQGLLTDYSALIIKLNPAGDTVKTLIIPPEVNYAHLTNVLKLNDTVFAAIGIKQILGLNNAQIWYLKFDKDLNILNEKIIGDTAFTNAPNNARISQQNEILIAGTALTSNGSGNWQAMLYRLSLDGDSLQSFYLGDSLIQQGVNILELPDTSGYLLFGSGFQPNNGLTQIIQLDTIGTIDTIYETTNPSAYGTTARWTSDSTFTIASAGYSSFTEFDLSFKLYDLNFNVLADTLMGSVDTIDREAKIGLDFITPDNIFGAGTINSHNTWFEWDQSFYYLIKFNSSMVPQWEKIISHNNDYLTLWCVRATNDGGVLMAGTSYNHLTANGIERDIYVIKLDSLGNLTTGINEKPQVKLYDVILFPNPAHDVIHISSTINFTASKIILFDTEGRKVMDKKFNKNASFSVAELNAGIYFYEIKDTKGKVEHGKIVKE